MRLLSMRIVPALCSLALLVPLGCGKTAPDSGPDGQPDKKKDGRSGPNPKPAPKLGKADVTLTSKALAEEFGKDGRAAAARYKGKVLEVAGEAESIGRESDSQGYLTLKGDPTRASGFVRCVTADPRPWSEVTPGQHVTLKGKIVDVSSSPLLTECEIGKVDGPTAPALTVQALADEVAANAEAANKKYENKYVVLTGELESVAITADDAPRIFFKTSAGTTKIGCYFSNRDTKQLKALKPGQQLKVLAEYGAGASKEKISLGSGVLMEEPK